MKHLLLSLLLLLAASARADSDEDFLAARDAFRAGEAARLDYLAWRLSSHVLHPYVAFWQLRLRLNDATAEEVAAFIARYAETPIAEKARLDWLKVLGMKGQWAALLAGASEFGGKPDLELQCYLLTARLQSNDPSVLSEARPLWHSDADLPEACAPVLDTLVDAKAIGREEMWQRFRLLLAAGKLGAAKGMSAYLPAREIPPAKMIDKAAANPGKYLKKPAVSLKTRGGRELALYSLIRVARTDLDEALPLWVKLSPQFAEADRKYVWARFATLAAKRHDPAALKWFDLAGSLDSEQHGWKVRAALRERRWPLVLASIEQMTPADQKDPTWRYWKARALKALGRDEEAVAIFEFLAREHHFYGQLAANELESSIEPVAQGYKPSEEEVSAIEQLPAIARALAFYKMDLRAEGNAEWQWAVSRFNDEQLLAAAEFARRRGIYDRAIYTANRTVQVHDFALRYLSPFGELVRKYARELNLDEAWVYGLIRQESRFILSAKSSAGAMGLMQIMPATAKWIARQMGTVFRKAEIDEIDTNISFGTFYLKYVLESLDSNPVLASAAYNAGPSRARRWRGEEPLEGAIYAETIPFSETRDYVKKVMSNTTYYAALLGNPGPSLKTRLGTIGARGRGELVADSEP